MCVNDVSMCASELSIFRLTILNVRKRFAAIMYIYIYSDGCRILVFWGVFRFHVLKFDLKERGNLQTIYYCRK